MALSQRLGGFLVGGVALALTITGVILAATDPNPSGVSVDHLALNGFPPSSVQMKLTISSSQGFGLAGDVNIDFNKNVVAGDLSLGQSALAVGNLHLLWKNNLLALGSNISTPATWLTSPLAQASLYGYSLELTKPDIALISGFSNESVTTANNQTTYTYSRDHAPLTNPFAVGKTTTGQLTWVIVTGSQGEVVSSSLNITTAHSTTNVNLAVQSYNQPFNESIPKDAVLTPLAPAALRSLLKPLASATLFLPSMVNQLAQSFVK